jgi:predicted ribosomally synthesized peptide with nif11-like leader
MSQSLSLLRCGRQPGLQMLSEERVNPLPRVAHNKAVLRAVPFLAKIDADVRMQEQLREVVPETISDVASPVVEFASRHGFEFTERELEHAAAARGGKLSDAQIDAMAGGGFSIEDKRLPAGRSFAWLFNSRAR